MNELTTINTKQTMTSLQIAEVTGREHKNILRDIRNLIEQGADELNFELISYTDDMNREKPCYQLSGKGVLILASGYNVKLREKIIDRWEALETGQAKPAFSVPQSFAEALMLAAKQQEQIEQQHRQLIEDAEEIKQMATIITEQKPKVSYYDLILNCKGTQTVTSIAQDYGMSAKKFNILLRNYGIQHKVGSQWILYTKYLNEGYVQSKPFTYVNSQGINQVTNTTEWTQKGRLFLYNTLKEHGTLPMIER